MSDSSGPAKNGRLTHVPLTSGHVGYPCISQFWLSGLPRDMQEVSPYLPNAPALDGTPLIALPLAQVVMPGRLPLAAHLPYTSSGFSMIQIGLPVALLKA